MDLNGMTTYVAALSVSIERVTEFIKRFPAFSNFLSAQKTGPQEDIRILCVQGQPSCRFSSLRDS